MGEVSRGALKTTLYSQSCLTNGNGWELSEEINQEVHEELEILGASLWMMSNKYLGLHLK